MSGFQELTGIVHPLLVILGWILYTIEIKKLTKVKDLSYFCVINISYFWFYYHAVPDVLDSFFKYETAYAAIVPNMALAFLMQPLILVLPISKMALKKYNLQDNLSAIIGLAFIFSAISSYVLIIFPNSWAYSLADWIDYLNLLPWIGCFGYAFIIFLSIIYFGIYNGKKSATVLGFISIFLLVHVVPIKSVKYKLTAPVEIGLVQFPFHLYNKEGNFPEPRRLKQLIKKTISMNNQIDVLYYPEGSALAVNEGFQDWLGQEYTQILKQAPEVILSGYKIENNDTFNTLIKISQYQAPQVYYKSKLFPIGESDWLGLAKIINPHSKSLASKNLRTIWDIRTLNTLPLLCFENYHSFFVLQKMQQETSAVDLITIQSNESWVQSNMTRNNMFKFIKLQAKELGVAIAKIDSAGPTALISAEGKVVSKNYYPVEVVTASVNKLENNSFYSRYGASIVLILALLLIVISWLEKSLLNEKGE